MCGFVFIKHLKSNLNKSLAMRLAEEYISNRGPDYCKYYSTNDEFAFQSVLAIQSEINNPQIKLIKNKTRPTKVKSSFPCIHGALGSVLSVVNCPI